MKRRHVLFVTFLWPLLAAGDESRVIAHARIKVADVATASAEVGAVDLGPAPPPGGSRLFGRAEIEERVRAAGLETKGLKVPASVRVVSASVRLRPEELAKMAAPVVMRALPEGVTLTKIEPQHELVTYPGCTVKGAVIPRLPHQKGLTQSTAMLELSQNDADSIKIPVSITVDVSDAAAKADVPRGTRIEVIFERGAVRIATTGVATQDAEIGDTTNVSLVATARTVRARVVSKERAEIVEHP